MSRRMHRTRRSARSAALVAGVVTALLAAPLTPAAQAGPGDPGELWVNVTSDATFDWLEGATATVYDDAGNPLDTAVTDEFGDAGFTGLDPGTYYVSAVADGHVEEFYDDSPDFAGAWPLTVDDSFSESAWMSLAAEPQIEGTLTGPGGTPLEFAEVTVYQYDAAWDYWDWTSSASTDESGAYTLGGLDAGTYRLGFTADGHIEEYFDNKPDVESGNDVTVSAGGAPVVADAELDLAKHITGTVTAGGAPASDVQVTAQQLVEDFGDLYWEDVAYASTEADGTYSLAVDPGDYRVHFESGSHLPEWWDDAHVDTDADLVAVTTGDVAGIDATLDEGGSIAGTVSAFGGAPLEDAWVTAYRWNAEDSYWEDVASASSGPTGTYAIDNLLGGTYRVGFQTFDGDFLEEYYNGAEQVADATDVAVTIGNTTGGINATLDKAGIIQGTVSGPGVSAANLDVSLYEPDRFAESGWSESFAFPEITGTTYRFTGLEPGSYRVRASAPGLAPEFYPDVYEVGQATDVVAAKNTTSTANMTLATAPTISGTVSNFAAPVGSANVLVQRKTTGTDGRFWDDYAFATTDGTGNYTTAVPPGTYRLRFSHSDHVTEWHDGSATPSRSTQLAVSGTNLDVDATLDRLGRIAGTVTGPSGAVNGALVDIWRYENSFGEGSYRRIRTGIATNAAGGYSVTGLQPGNYRVGFRAPGLEPEFNLDEADVEYADDVAVELNQTRTINAALDTATLQLSGTVTAETDAAPVPLEGADVIVQRRVVRLDDVVAWREVANVQTNAAGAWSVPVIDGDYRVYFTDGGYVDEYYDDAATAAEATVVTVAGANRTGIDAELARGGTITGTVTDAATSAPLGDAEVYAFMPNGDDDEFAFANSNGAFTLTGLAPGEWVVQYEADGYVREYYDDQPTQSTADRITVTAGGTVTADAALGTATAVSGTVTGTGGAPLDSVWVDLHRVLEGGEVDYFAAWASTDSDGTWTTQVPPGTYLVEFNGQGDYLGQWYDGVASEATATEVVVGSTPVTGIDAQLQLGGVIAGTVTGPGGAPVPDAYVSVLPADATQDWQSVWEGFVDDDGTYRSDALPAGSYKVRFETFQGSLVPEYHLDKADLASANPVAVALGATATVNAQLAAHPRLISGTVTDAQDRGLDDVEVGLYRRSGDAWTWQKDVATDADGNYALPVSAGEYRLFFAEYDNRLFEWWNDADTLAEATTVLVGGVDRTDIDAQLADGGVVTGTVTYPAQVTGWSSSVVLYDATSGEWVGSATVDAHQNRYRIDDLPTGTYRAEISRTGGFDTAEAQYWNGRAEHLGRGTQTIPVTEGVTTPNINATLVDGGILTGIVQDGQGNPLTGCRVSAYTPDGSLVLRQSRLTSPDGTFRVRGLTTGTYRLRVLEGECGFTPLYYDGVGQTSASSANAVGVAATRASSAAVPQPLVVPTSGSIQNSAVPTISDPTPEVGQTLTAGPGSWNETGLTFAYQWLADGTPIAGATGATYVVAAGDAGKALTVRVTASKPDYVDGIATSAPTADVVSGDPPITNTAAPTISDTTPQVGQALTSTNGTWSETGLTFARQWTADGVDIPGATTAGYTVQAADQGKVLRVRVTASKTGFATGTATSAATSPVAAGTIANTALPTVSGTPRVGQTLTAAGGTWTPADVSLAYQWLRNGTAVPGATGTTYALAAADQGQPMSVRVTATKPGHTQAQATSAATAAVAAATITNSVAPTITDTTPELGQTLSSTPGTWSPADVTLAYQWLRNDQPITGATSASYTTVQDDVGKTLKLRVTGSKPGHTTLPVTTAATSVVVDPSVETIENLTVPTISGTPTVGNTLTANGGTWDPADATLAYQWLRGGTPVPAPAGTGTTYALTAADQGQQMSVRVTASKAGFNSAERTSGPTAPVAAATIVNTAVPTITGTVKVGNVLSTTGGTWNPADVTRSYRWTRNGTAIPGATGSSYTLVAADLGRAIRVEVTANKTGMVAGNATSAPTAAVTAGTITASKPKVAGTTKVGKTLKAKIGTSTPSEVTVKYQWLRNGKAIKRATKAKYKLVKADKGRKISVKVTRTAAGYSTLVLKSAQTAKIK